MIVMGKHKLERETAELLGGRYGLDKDRKLVVGLALGDVITFRPKGTRQAVTVQAKDVFEWCLQNLALRRHLARARERKAKLQIMRDRRRIADAERRLKKGLRNASD